jgi:hypothetical protein
MIVYNSALSLNIVCIKESYDDNSTLSILNNLYMIFYVHIVFSTLKFKEFILYNVWFMKT